MTNLVLTGSLWPARRIASRASGSGTPESSNITRPGLTTATQPSGLPLPEPMRVSAGFLVKGLSGKTLIHTFPPRLILRVIAMRAASIGRLVSQPGSSALMPYSPNCTVVWPRDVPVRRPRCCLRCLVRLGWSINDRPLRRHGRRRPARDRHRRHGHPRPARHRPPAPAAGTATATARTATATATAPISPAAVAPAPVAVALALRGGRLEVGEVGAGVALGHDLALVYPALDADAPEGRARLVEAVVDVGAQRVQRHAP